MRIALMVVLLAACDGGSEPELTEPDAAVEIDAGGPVAPADDRLLTSLTAEEIALYCDSAVGAVVGTTIPCDNGEGAPNNAPYDIVFPASVAACVEDVPELEAACQKTVRDGHLCTEAALQFGCSEQAYDACSEDYCL